MKLICRYKPCGKEFDPKQGKAKKTIFCSIECSMKHHNETQRLLREKEREKKGFKKYQHEEPSQEKIEEIERKKHWEMYHLSAIDTVIGDQGAYLRKQQCMSGGQ